MTVVCGTMFCIMLCTHILHKHITHTEETVVLCHTGSSMLQLIREVSAKVGKEEDAEDYKALERIIQSNNFKNVMEVSVFMCMCKICEYLIICSSFFFYLFHLST